MLSAEGRHTLRHEIRPTTALERSATVLRWLEVTAGALVAAGCGPGEGGSKGLRLGAVFRGKLRPLSLK